MSIEDQTTTGRLQELRGVENKIILKKFFSYGKKIVAQEEGLKHLVPKVQDHKSRVRKY